MLIKKHLHAILTALLILSGCTYNVIPRSYSAESIEAWVVDEATGKPLEGVIVVAHWPLEVERHYSWVGELQIMETVTDKNGRFYFPAWGPKYAERGHLTYRDPEILLYKDGYRWKSLSNTFTTKIITKQRHESIWDGKTISVSKFFGDLESYASHISQLDTLLSFLYEKSSKCYWKNSPKILLAMHLKRREFYRKKISIGPRSIEAVDNSCNVKEYYRDYLK